VIDNRNYDWWKRVLLRKYFTGSRKRCLDSNYASREGSPIWKLIKSTIPILQSKLSWAPRSGRMIEIWNDSIMGNPLIITNQELHPLKVWLDTQGKKLSLTSLDGPKMVGGLVGTLALLLQT
jgi:hypothetical protein